jgi:hypothetical protein
LRYVAVGRNSRSLPLLSGGASGCSKKVAHGALEHIRMALLPHK